MIAHALKTYAAWLCLAGLLCSAAPAHADDATTAAGDDAYYLIGVTPADAQLVIAPGEIRNGKFVTDGAEPIPAQPVDGFILGKLDKAGRLAVTGIAFNGIQPEGGVVQRFYLSIGIRNRKTIAPCGDGITVAFTPLPHKVLYVGTVQYSLSRFQYEQYPQFLVGADLDKARAFLQAKYPELAARVEQGSYEFRSLDRDCK